MEAMSPERYDAGWDTRWDDMKTYGPFSRHVRRLIRHAVKQLTFDSVLDVGCGQGALLDEFRRAYPEAELAGTDFSASAVRIAQQRVPGAQVSILDLTARCLDRQFDLVICSEVLEHIPDDLAALRNLRKMTGGHLVVTTPQGRMRSFEAGEVGHVRNYAPGELQAKMRQTGFDVVKVIEWGFPLYSPLYRDYLALTSGRGTTGTFGPVRKRIAAAVYYLFMLNSWRRGDELVVLARPSRQGDGVSA